MKITHVRSRLILGNNQKRLERTLIDLKHQNQEVIQIINNFGSFSLFTIALGLLSPLRVYTIISKDI